MCHLIHPSNALRWHLLASATVVKVTVICSDEVYANSLFKPCNFTSMARLAANASQHGLDPSEVQSYVHIIFGMSKDWCASGLRVGCLYTQHTALLKAMQNLSYFGCVSGMAQYMVAEMLEDLPFVDSFLAENARRLGGSYDTLAGVCGCIWALQLRWALLCGRTCSCNTPDYN